VQQPEKLSLKSLVFKAFILVHESLEDIWSTTMNKIPN